MVLAPSGDFHFIVASSCTKPGHAVRVATAPADEALRASRSSWCVANGLLELKRTDGSWRPQRRVATDGVAAELNARRPAGRSSILGGIGYERQHA